jgi:predicted transcriptional regulator
MNTVVISVGSRDKSKKRFIAAMHGEPSVGRGPQGAFITFPSIELLYEVLSVKRWRIVQAMIGQGPLSVHEIARQVNRDVKAVHGGLQGLVAAGIVDRDGERYVFPYDDVRVEFNLEGLRTVEAAG